MYIMLNDRNLFFADSFEIRMNSIDGLNCSVIAISRNENFIINNDDYLSCVEFIGKLAQLISEGRIVLYVRNENIEGIDPYND